MSTTSPLLWGALLLMTTTLTACDSGQSPQTSQPDDDQLADSTTPYDNAEDPFLWLEDVEGEEALDWVREQNTRSLAVLEADPRFEGLRARAEAIYTAQDRIAYAGFQGNFLSNFWQDATHVRGILRITSLDSYISAAPKWETVLDLDALAEAENENWVYKGRSCLAPDNTRCLLRLSRGGADAVVLREYDLTTKSFVDGGFEMPEAKQNVDWIDQDTLLIGTPNEGGTVTTSGYANELRIWKRGSALADAPVVFVGEESDVGSFAAVSHRPEGTTVLAIRAPSFFTEQIIHIDGAGAATKLALPEDVNFQGMFHGHVLALMRSDWMVGDTTVPAGAMAALPLDGLLVGEPSIAFMLPAPESGSIQAISAGRDVIWVDLLDDVTGELKAVRLAGGQWSVQDIAMPANGAIGIVSADDMTNKALINYESHLTPDSLYLVDADNNTAQALKSLPARFDADGLVTEQRFATSSDGTQVPYFIVRPADLQLDGTAPTLLYGYGGFEVSLTPGYLGALASGWLENGGVYVVANIRGGGEYGPAWHQAALKENRQRAFDDFAAVAEHLIATQVTSPDHLGIYGGSNGGLLVGTAFTQRPDLYNAVICAVPLLDMLRYHKLLAGASWMGEYGDPDVAEERAYIAAYSPYQNLQASTDYPEVFFTTSTRDDRVHPGHARKMAAKMAENGQPFLYYENIEGGHSAAANLKQVAYRDALSTVYLLQKLAD